MKAFFIISPVTLVISICLFVGMLCFGVIQAERFDISCGDYLNRAAASNTIPLAESNLKQGIMFLESHNMTHGNTGVLYNTPAEDVGFMYANLTGAEKSLEDIPTNADELTKSNALLKLHESLQCIKLSGIAIFPHNTLFELSLFADVGLGFASICLYVVSASENQEMRFKL